MGLLEARRLVDECLGLVRLKRDFAVINNLIDRYKEALADFYDKWADDFAGKAVDVKNEFQWFALRDSALQGLERQMVAFGNELLPEAFEMGLTEEMTDELEFALQKEIAVNNTWIRNSLVPNIRQLSEGYWDDRDSYPRKSDVKAIWMRRAYQVGQYAGAAWTAFWTGRVEEQPSETWWLWEGTRDDNTCTTCGERIGIVYRSDDLPGIPGDVSSECGCNCRCWLEQVNARLMGMLEPMLGDIGDPTFDKDADKVKLDPKKPAMTEMQAKRLQGIVDEAGRELAGKNRWTFNKLDNDAVKDSPKTVRGLKHWDCSIYVNPGIMQKLNAVFADPSLLTRDGIAVDALRTLNHEMHHGINSIRPSAYSGAGAAFEEGLTEALARARMEEFVTMLFGPEIGTNLAPWQSYSYVFEVRRTRELALLASGGDPTRVTDIMMSWKSPDGNIGRWIAVSGDVAKAWGGSEELGQLVMNYVTEEDFWKEGEISDLMFYNDIALRAEGFDSMEWFGYFTETYWNDAQ